MVEIAICYYGMTRSTRFVYKSHHENIFDVIKMSGINYDIFMHTWSTPYNRIWNKISEVPIDYNEYQLLAPTVYRCDKQEDYLKTVNMADYFDHRVFARTGRNGSDEWWPELIQNHICALESQKRVTEMAENMKDYDYIMYIRPDVEIETPFPIDVIINLKKNMIAIPNANHNEGYNDRFAFLPWSHHEFYGKRIRELKEFRKKNGRITSEKYVKFIIDKYFGKPLLIDFQFTIVRPK
jgi:hypothetical protein